MSARPARSRLFLAAWLVVLRLIAARPFAGDSLAALPSAAPPPAGFRITERSDFSRYRNGAYVGHAWREAKGRLEPVGQGAWDAEFLVFEETLRDQRQAAKAIDRSGETRLFPGPAGLEARGAESGFPTLRGIPPALPDELLPGGVWQAPGARIVDPGGGIEPFRAQVLVEYRYEGRGSLGGTAVERVTGKFALRWRGPPGSRLLQANGSHELELSFEAASGRILLIRDRFDETYALEGGTSERQAGFLLVFFDGSPPLDRVLIASALGGVPATGAAGSARATDPSRAATGPGSGGAGQGPAGSPGGGPAGGGPGTAAGPGAQAGGGSPVGPGGTGGPGVAVAPAPLAMGPGPLLAAAGLELDESERGVVLRASDLRFVADGAELLPSEKPRLDALAEALRSVLAASPGASFLVEGHAAAVGKPRGELELSALRARRVVDELVARGLPAAGFAYRGLGSTRPIAGNDTEEGRARNRRVEVTVLD